MCCVRWCGRQLCLHNMPISGVNSTPRPTAVYASDPALPRRPQDSLPSCLLGFGRTRLSLASSFQLSYRTPHPALGQDFTLARATSSAASEPFIGVDRLPNLQVLHHVLRLSRTAVPSLHRRYPASALLRTSPPPQGAQPVPHGFPVGPR